MDIRINDTVRKIQDYPGSSVPITLGRSTVARIAGKRVTLADGSSWRVSDGCRWGSVATRGVGCSFEPRIEVIASAVPYAGGEQ